MFPHKMVINISSSRGLLLFVISSSLYLVSLFFLVGCENIPNETIDVQSVNYIVEEIMASDVVVYSSADPFLYSSIKIKNTESVENVWFDVYNFDNSERIIPLTEMTTAENTSAKTYSGKAEINKDILSGSYQIYFYVEDNIRIKGENILKVGNRKFEYLSKAQNFPPVISKLSIPNEIPRGVEFVFSVFVEDPNGLNDIKEVYFGLLRPDSSIVYSDENNKTKKFPLFDNGDKLNAGDEKAGDGIYSLKNSFGENSQTGDWTFTFAAIDKSDSLSNTIIHILNVK